MQPLLVVQEPRGHDQSTGPEDPVDLTKVVTDVLLVEVREESEEAAEVQTSRWGRKASFFGRDLALWVVPVVDHIEMCEGEIRGHGSDVLCCPCHLPLHHVETEVSPVEVGSGE